MNLHKMACGMKSRLSAGSVWATTFNPGPTATVAPGSSAALMEMVDKLPDTSSI